MSNTKNINFGASRLQLKRFPIEKMAEHCTIAMIAKRASGKSYLTKEILYHKRHIPAVSVISKTEKLNWSAIREIQRFLKSKWDPI